MTTAASDPQVNPEPPDDDDDHEERPALKITARGLVGITAFLLLALAALYFLVPKLAGLDETWSRIEDGRPAWTIAALFLTCGMYLGYVVMFRGVYGRAAERIGWAASYQITFAGLAASRLFAAGGAGGLVVTAWALRRSGMRKRAVADKTISFLVLTYFPYAVAVIVCGFGLHYGLFSGPDPISLTFVPAVVGCVMIAIAVGARVRPARPAAAPERLRARGPLRAPDPEAGERARRRRRRGCATRSSTSARATRR